MKTILLMVVASVLWVQVTQWSDDWSNQEIILKANKVQNKLGSL